MSNSSSNSVSIARELFDACNTFKDDSSQWQRIAVAIQSARDEIERLEQESAILRECFEISRRGCFSRKRSERDKALSEINYKLGQFAR